MTRKTSYMFNNIVNERFKILVKENHLKQIDVAIALNTTTANVCRWINGKNGIGEPFFSRICEYFNVCSSWLKGECEFRNEQEYRQHLFSEWDNKFRDKVKNYNIYLIQSIESISNCYIHFEDENQLNEYIRQVIGESISIAKHMGLEISEKNSKPRRQRRKNDGKREHDSSGDC